MTHNFIVQSTIHNLHIRQGCQLLSSGMSETAGSAPIITETERDGGGVTDDQGVTDEVLMLQ